MSIKYIQGVGHCTIDLNQQSNNYLILLSHISATYISINGSLLSYINLNMTLDLDLNEFCLAYLKFTDIATIGYNKIYILNGILNNIIYIDI